MDPLKLVLTEDAPSADASSPEPPERVGVAPSAASDDRALAEQLQDRWRRDRQTARVLREYLIAHGRPDGEP